jgi:AcrR family transcriptional regulator
LIFIIGNSKIIFNFGPLKQNGRKDKMSKDDFNIKIVTVAAEVFNRYGFKKTTMDEIAQQLGKGKSSIYYYFKSKEEIFKAVVEMEAMQLRADVRKSIEATNDPQEQIKNYVLTRIGAYKNAINFNNALEDNVLLHLEFTQTIRDTYDKYEIELVKKILIEGVKSGAFAIENPSIASAGIVTALKGLQGPILESLNEKEIEEKLDSLLSILFYGIIRR